MSTREADLTQRGQQLSELSPSYAKAGSVYVRQLLAQDPQAFGLSPEQAQNLDLDHTYWVEFEPRHLPSNGPVGYPPRDNPKAGQFVRAVPLSQVPVTNLPDTGQGDDRFHITGSNDRGQTFDAGHDVITPARFAQAFAQQNDIDGGFKARYQHEVGEYFQSHHGAISRLQHDRAQFLLDRQQASGQVKEMGENDYRFLQRAIRGGGSDPSLTINPLEIGSVAGSQPYVSPSALVIHNTQPNGATYLYLPREPQPYLRFRDNAAATQYLQHRTDDPVSAHDFAAAYFSQNDAAGSWNAQGVEHYLNSESDYRRSQRHPTVGDKPGTEGDKYLLGSQDISADPFGKLVDIAQGKALDQANFDITANADKADQRRYDEAGKYWYLPGRQLVQLAYAKTGTQKQQALGSLAEDIGTQVVFDGLGKAFGNLGKDPRFLEDSDASATGWPRETPSTGTGNRPPPSGSRLDPGTRLPPAAGVTEDQLQPAADLNGIRVGKDGYTYARAGSQYYRVRQDADLSKPGQPVYRAVDPDNPYAFDAPVLVPDGQGGWAVQAMNRGGGPIVSALRPASGLRNGALAKQVYEEVKQAYRVGLKSGNKAYSHGPKAESSKQRATLADQKISQIRAQWQENVRLGKIVPPSDELIIPAANCGELARIAAKRVVERGGYAEVWKFGDADHAFTVVGRPPEGELVHVGESRSNILSTWKDVWIVDPWANIVSPAPQYIEALVAKMKKWEASNKVIFGVNGQPMRPEDDDWVDAIVNGFIEESEAPTRQTPNPWQHYPTDQSVLSAGNPRI